MNDRCFLIFSFCSLIAVSAYAALQGGSDSGLAVLQNGDLEVDFSGSAQNGPSKIDSIKDRYGVVADEAAENSRRIIPDTLPELLQSTVDAVYQINYADLPYKLKTRIAQHPYQTTFHIANRIVFFYPNLLTVPVFWSLGWTSIGPRAGSTEAALMAKFGAVPSRGGYAIFQSSAMGGYGRAVVQGVTRAGSVAFGASELVTSR